MPEQILVQALFTSPNIPVETLSLRTLYNQAAEGKTSLTTKKENIYVNQSQELLRLIEEAEKGLKVLCVSVDYAKRDHVTTFCFSF